MSNTKPEIKENKPSDVEFAEISMRILAWIIDVVVSWVIYFGVMHFLLYRLLLSTGFYMILSTIVWYLVSLFYFWLLESINGQTLGKLIAGIRTVDEDTLEVSSFTKNLKNCFLKCFWFTLLIVIDLVIGAIKISNDPQNRIRIMQKVSHTVVIKTTTK